jgi:hypothetical protein
MRSPSERRQHRQRMVGLLLIAGVLLVVAAVAAARWRIASRAVALDPESFCPEAGGPRGHLAVIVDVSDPPNAVQRAALRKEVLDLETSIPAYHRVRIFVIRAADPETLPEPVFDKCKPPAPDAGDPGLYTNPGQLQRRWLEGYRAPFEKALDGPYAATPESPLMELIQSAEVSAFPAHSDPAPRRMVVVSDFLQHTKSYSHYGAAPPRFDDFERSPYARKGHADLSRFDVSMLYLRRDGQERVQTPDHLEFWKRFFVWSGVEAGRLEVTPIEG